MDTDSLIGLISQITKKLSNKRTFLPKFYTDEPILRPASSLQNYMPPDIADLKSYGRQLYFEKYRSEEEIFVRQAERAVDIIDNADPVPPFFIYRPTYRSLTDKQLRAYFSWRHQLRQGQFSENPAFVMLHMNELIHLIGADSAEDAFDRLCELYEHCSDKYVINALCLTLTDFYVYYQPDRSPSLLPVDLTDNKLLCVLCQAQTADDESLYTAISAVCAYHFDKSRFFKAHPELSRTAVCNTYRLVDNYYRETSPLHLFTCLFGRTISVFHPLFRSAVFFERTPHAEATVDLTPLLRYTYQDGAWWRHVGYYSPKPEALLTHLMRNVDVALRKACRDPHRIKQAYLPDDLQALVDEAVRAALAPKPKVIDIDLTKLDAIRRAADSTCEKLLVDEETDTPLSPPTPPPARHNTTPLDDAEYAVLCCLLDGGDAHTVAGQHHRMLSVVCDSINDKLFDIIGDSVIDFDGDTPRLIDEYVDDLKGLISS